MRIKKSFKISKVKKVLVVISDPRTVHIKYDFDAASRKTVVTINFHNAKN